MHSFDGCAMCRLVGEEADYERLGCAGVPRCGGQLPGEIGIGAFVEAEYEGLAARDAAPVNGEKVGYVNASVLNEPSRQRLGNRVGVVRRVAERLWCIGSGLLDAQALPRED